MILTRVKGAASKRLSRTAQIDSPVSESGAAVVHHSGGSICLILTADKYASGT